MLAAILVLSTTLQTTPLQPIGYDPGTLGAGPARQLLDETKAYYLAIPNDDLLLGFRRRAGKPAPGKELGGWYSQDVFHVFGQILSGLARMYGATGDPACKRKAESLLAGWGECIAPDGYFYFSTKPNARHYIYDKMVGGLVDLELFCGNRRARQYLSKITDWAIKNLDRTRPYGQDGNEWYTLSENLFRAYQLTGDPKYRDFARVWEYTDYWNRFATGQSIFAKRGVYHAYSHVNTLGGAAMAYREIGDKRYLATIVNAYDWLQSEQCYATGGYGPDEGIMPHDQLTERLQTTNNTFETQCGSWAAFKLCKQLISLTGQAKYGDWVERLLLNGLEATIPMTADGRVMYYSDYNLYGGQKRNIDFGWSCCAGTRPMVVADVCDQIYFKNAEGISVSLFLPSSAKIAVKGGWIAVKQTTDLPESPTVTFDCSGHGHVQAKLRIRKPSWVSGEPKVEGNRLIPVTTRDGWLVIEPKWTASERIRVTFPMAFRSIPIAKSGFPTAIAYGPSVLTFRSGNGSPARKVDFKNLASNFVPSPGEALTWRLRSDPNVLVRPFAKLKEGEEYFTYLDPAAADRIPWRKMRFEGAWNDGSTFRWANQIGSWAETTFEGDSIRWLGWKFDDAGKAEVRIDGTLVATVDQYGPGRGLPFDWHRAGLGPGKHTIRITVIEAKNPDSKNRFINIAGVETAPAH